MKLLQVFFVAFTHLLVVSKAVNCQSDDSIPPYGHYDDCDDHYVDDSWNDDYYDDYCEDNPIENPTCSKPNEVYDPCPSACPARTCGIDDRVIFCRAGPKPGDPNCPAPACRCDSGYFRNKNGQCVTWEECSKTQPATCSANTAETLLKGNAKLTGKCIYEAYKSVAGKNLIISIFSLMTPLSELGLYAKDRTYEQIIRVLNLQSKDEIRCAFSKLIGRFSEQKEVVFNQAARIFATATHPLSKAFLNDTKYVFNAEAESLDFLNAKAAADRINQWVESQTNDRIKNIADQRMFNEYTRLVLANAIYFLGNWERQFPVTSTVDRDFYVDKNTKTQIPTMYQKAYFKYAEVENLNCKVLEMPYKGGNFSFVVFLPNEVDGLPQLIEKLQDPYAFNGAYDSANNAQVMVYLPKIKIESEYNLVELLKKVGISDIFDDNLSKLDNILEQNVPLYISAAKQKAFVEVDEKGTEAAAANIFVVGEITSVGNSPPVYSFIADHPFAFYILNKRDILFGGIFSNKK